MSTNLQTLESAKYVNEFAKRHEKRVRIQRIRTFMQTVMAFAMGLGAMAFGLYAIKNFDLWSPYIQHWVRQAF